MTYVYRVSVQVMTHFIFEKININNRLLSEEKQEASIFYNPIKEISSAIYPSIEEWYSNIKSEVIGEEEKNNPI